MPICALVLLLNRIKIEASLAAQKLSGGGTVVEKSSGGSKRSISSVGQLAKERDQILLNYSLVQVQGTKSFR